MAAPVCLQTGEESPGSMEIRCQLTAGGGDPRESATESKPPDHASHQERVKGCGKSAPVLQQCGTHGKPHREQNLIGMVGRMFRHCRQAVSASPFGLVAGGVRRRASQMNGHPMRLAAGTEPGLQAIWSYFYTRDTTKAMTQGHRLADDGQHFVRPTLPSTGS